VSRTESEAETRNKREERKRKGEAVANGVLRVKQANILFCIVQDR